MTNKARGARANLRASIGLALVAVVAATVYLASSGDVWLMAGALALVPITLGLSRLVRPVVRRLRPPSNEAPGGVVRGAWRRHATRVLWTVTGDFDDGGWARSELEALCLIARNLERDGRPGPALARRLDGVVNRVLTGVLDRADDVVRLARRCGVRPDEARRVARGLTQLAELLADWNTTRDAKVVWEPLEVIGAATDVIDGAAAIREALRPAIVCNVVPLLETLAGARGGRGRRLGGLRIELVGVAVGERALVSPVDLADALSGLLTRLGREIQEPHILLVAEARRDRVELRISWRRGESATAALSDLLAPLRGLASYGARIAEEQAPRGASGTVSVILPRATTGAWGVAAGRAASRSDGSLQRFAVNARRP
ncbi:MAG: hypothetical protein OEQ13_04495 [Acidobacteriota bacterium]|nr:hypothetical protein [Acidobacteriota bacterium]